MLLVILILLLLFGGGGGYYGYNHYGPGFAGGWLFVLVVICLVMWARRNPPSL